MLPALPRHARGPCLRAELGEALALDDEPGVDSPELERDPAVDGSRGLHGPPTPEARQKAFGPPAKPFSTAPSIGSPGDFTLSASSLCTRCGFQNQPGYQFCTNCGAPLGPAAGAPPQAAAPPGYAPAAAYGYAPSVADYDRTKQIDRTKTGVLLLLIGTLLLWIPYDISVIGDLMIFVGAILIILGRKAFGPAHARNVVVSIILFVVGIFVVIVVAVIALIPSLPTLITPGGAITPAGLAAAQSAALAGGIGSAVVIGLAEVLFTYALQRQTGRILLWAGYGANLAVSIALYALMSPIYASVVTNADLTAATGQQLAYGLLIVVPSILFAAADYLAWSRISRREIPAAAAPPGMPPYAVPPAYPPAYPPQTPPTPPQAPPPGGPAPPMPPP